MRRPDLVTRGEVETPGYLVRQESDPMYKYRITIEALDSTSDLEDKTIPSLSFDVANHDDLFHIVEVVRSKEIVDLDKAAALAIGLKLLSEVALEKRRDPLFASLSGPLRGFVQQLKTIPSASS